MALLFSCGEEANNGIEPAGLMVFNAKIWTGVDCAGVENPAGRRLLRYGHAGQSNKVKSCTSVRTPVPGLRHLTAETRRIDAEGQFLMPGFMVLEKDRASEVPFRVRDAWIGWEKE
jgi:hypothetical protein